MGSVITVLFCYSQWAVRVGTGLRASPDTVDSLLKPHSLPSGISFLWKGIAFQLTLLCELVEVWDFTQNHRILQLNGT